MVDGFLRREGRMHPDEAVDIAMQDLRARTWPRTSHPFLLERRTLASLLATPWSEAAGWLAHLRAALTPPGGEVRERSLPAEAAASPAIELEPQGTPPAPVLALC